MISPAIDAEYLGGGVGLWYNRGASINSRSAAANSLRPDTERDWLSMQPHDTTPAKVCTKCGEPKLATTEYFRVGDGRYGLRSQCKACEKLYRDANKERTAAYGRAWHLANRERRLEAGRKRRAADPEKARRAHRAYYLANKEKVLARGRARFLANKERHHELTRAWYVANREQHNARVYAYRVANKDRVREWGRAYRAANPEVGRSALRRRRAREMQAEGTHTAADIQLQYKRQKGKCYWCGVKVGDKYHVDHVVPLSRGGSNWPENLVVACPSCNCSKSDKLPHEWAQGGRLL